jgi:hypothetical protein
MCSTLFRAGSYRFFSREDPRKHVHVTCPAGEAKFWIEPIIALATYYGLSKRQLKEVELLVEANFDEINSAWEKHFSR